MKKYLMLFLMMFALSFAFACGEDKEDDNKQNENNEQEEIKEFTVKFVADGTETQQTVKDGEKAVKPADPVKEGYTFVGWFVGDAEYTFDAVKADVTVTAKFEEVKVEIKEFTVKFVVDDEETVQTVKEGEKASKPADPVKEGYVFLGWYVGEEAYDFEKAVTADVELVAKFEEEKVEIKEYTVKFVVDGEASEVKVAEGEKASKPADPVKEGYNFLGWYVGSEAYDFDAAVTADVELVAKFEEVVIEKFTVKFIVDGVVVSEQLVEKGKDAELPEDPVKEGADFGYWDGIYEKIQKDEEVVAVFDYYLYAVVFMADGQLYGDPAEVEHGQDCPAPADPVKEGYKFVGWDKELTNITYELIVNAIFELETYTIKYYADGVELTDIEPKTYTYEDAFELTVNDVEGYGFLGWFDNADYIGEAKTGIAAKSFGDIELYALNVKVDNNGAEESWTWEEVAGYDYSKGIDAISNLPEVFEADFFKYLSDNNLLDDSRVGDTVKVSSWAEFSQVNPIHNGDPQRIWNDTTSNKTGTPNGYVSIFLFDKLEVNDDLTIKDVTGGFLGTEPYKTKYFGLLSSLVIMQNYKISKNKYISLATSTDTARAFCAFIIDGYFYGTQGLADSYFAELRKVIPGTTYGYKLVGESIVKVDYEKSPMAIGVKEGYVFDGWYIDQECTKKVGSEKMTNKQTIYVKWSPVA